jgi:multidrug transporter EmrE-like cation transporter
MKSGYLGLAVSILFNSLANILIKLGMKKVSGQGDALSMMRKAVIEPAFIGGIVCFGLALAAYSMVLSKLNLSIAYPINVSLGLILVVLVSALFLKESITLLQISGFFLIIAGVWLVAR